MLALLKDALQPNLVQTLEGTPALVHGGPFANIAHGCNSVLATKIALHLADWAITEAGFGFDLGAEKFFDIKCVGAGLDTAAVVLVATVRALKLHGGVKLRDLDERPTPRRSTRGLPNLEKHIENITHFGEPPVVALNRFAARHRRGDRRRAPLLRTSAVAFAVTDHFARGGEGAIELARVVMDRAEKKSRPSARSTTGSWPVAREDPARRAEDVRRAGSACSRRRPSAICGTSSASATRGCRSASPRPQKSLSDDPSLRGRPTDFDVTVQSHPDQRRRRVPGRDDRRHHAHAGAARTAAGGVDRREGGEDRRVDVGGRDRHGRRERPSSWAQPAMVALAAGFARSRPRPYNHRLRRNHMSMPPSAQTITNQKIG